MNAPVLGIDIGGTNIKLGLVSDQGELLDMSTITTPQVRDMKSVVAVCTKGVRELLGRANSKPRGMGIAAAGVVDIAGEHVIAAPNFPDWKNEPLPAALSQALGLPAVLGNDVDLLGVAEHEWGAAVGLKHFIATAVGTGVGGAIFIDGKLYRGMSGGAAEVGFTVISPNGPVVSGVTGVLEGYIGRHGFDGIVGRHFPTGEFPSPRRITELANKGDPQARKVHDIVAGYLAEAVATWLHLLNPEAVVLGGGTLAGATYFFGVFEHKLKARALSTHTDHLQILPSKLGYYAGVQGAAALWMIESDAR
jgi:glucokinase